METLKLINFLIAVIFAVCYAYQFLYIPVVLVGRRKQEAATFSKKTTGLVPMNRFAVMICARNESAVIGDLIDSIHQQTYPGHLVTIFVMADNCTDETAKLAANKGAVVYERFNKSLVGKGYALEALLGHIKADYPEGFDGYFVFDADNILKEDYIEQMNLTFAKGYQIITSYRNSKNYGSNWISAGYALWFLRESRYLNHARSILGNSCAVSGTGFFFSRRIAERVNGWPFHMLTEDIEFSIDQITQGEIIGFCPKAELYDEQPVEFKQSWRQRMRWSRGYLQVIGGYWKPLFKGIFKGNFSCFDMTMNIMPAFFLSAASIVCNMALGIWGASVGDNVMIAVQSVAETFGNAYLMLFGIGLLTTVTEWRHIGTTALKKILYAFTFPLFMFTYIPIAFASLFFKTTWKPIVHTYSREKMMKDIA